MDKVRYLCLLLPGFIALGVARLVGDLPGASDFELSLLFFLMSVIAGIPVFLMGNYVFKRQNISVTLDRFVVSPFFLSGSNLIAVFLGIVIALAYERNWPNQAATYLLGSRLTLPKTSGRTTFEGIMRAVHDRTEFHDYDARAKNLRSARKALKVHFKSGAKSLVGMRVFWDTDKDDPPQLYLSPVCVENGTQLIPLAGAGSWINLNDVSRIDLLDAGKVACIQDQL